MRRTPDEIAKMRRAGRVVAEMHERTRAAARPGVTTADLDRELAARVDPPPRRPAARFTAIWFSNLEYRRLVHPDEGRYAEIPREMVVSGDWVTPRLNGIKYFEKPALQYWLTAAAYEAFGIHPWTARLWPALSGFLGVLFVGYVGLRLGGPTLGNVGFTVGPIGPAAQIAGPARGLTAGPKQTTAGPYIGLDR